MCLCKINKIEIHKEKHQNENIKNNNKTGHYVLVGDLDCNSKR